MLEPLSNSGKAAPGSEAEIGHGTTGRAASGRAATRALRQERLLALFVFAALFAAPFLTSNYTTRVLNLGVIASIAVLGLNFVFGWAGLISLAQAAFIGSGAYAAALLTKSAGLDAWSAGLGAVAITTIAAATIGFPMLRLSGHYLALATLGLNVTFEIVAANWVSLTGGTNGISGIPSLKIAGIVFGNERSFFFLNWTVLALLTLAAFRLRASPLGRAMIALRDDEIATRMSGVNVVSLKVFSFALGAGYAALSGALFSYHANFISPGDFGYLRSIFLLAMLILGGEGSILGAILGAVIVTFLPEWLRPLGDGYLTFFGVLLLLILVFLPRGLMSLLPMAQSRRFRAGHGAASIGGDKPEGAA
jgi:branched-chain amino acid transport system permease protein